MQTGKPVGAVSVDPGIDGSLAVVLRGELDFTNAAEIAAVIREAVADHFPRAVGVDLAEVSFLDSSGIGLLVQAMWAAEEISAGFQVRNPRAKVLDQLRLSGLLEPFGLADPGKPGSPLGTRPEATG